MQKWLCMQRGYGATERARITTNRNEIVLLEGDRIVYVPIYPGYYARGSAKGGRIRVDGTRLCKVAVRTRSYSSELTTGTTEWVAPYDGIYEIIINGAGGGASGGAEEYTEGHNDAGVTNYYYVSGYDGHGGEQITIRREYRANQRISTVVGKGGWTGRITEGHKRYSKNYSQNSGGRGSWSEFDGVRADGGAGGGDVSYGRNEHGGRGGTKKANPEYGYKHQPRFIETPAGDGSIFIHLLAGG